MDAKQRSKALEQSFFANVGIYSQGNKNTLHELYNMSPALVDEWVTANAMAMGGWSSLFFVNV